MEESGGNPQNNIHQNGEQMETEKVYYMVVDEKSSGPYTLEEMKAHPALMSHTLVWKPRLDNWVAAHTLPELEIETQRDPYPPKPEPPEYNPANESNRQYEHPHYGENHYGENHYGEPRQGNNQFANNPQYQPNYQYNPHRGTQYGPYGQQSYQEPGYKRHQQPGYRPSFRTNWLPWAIVATIAGFFTSCIGAIFGIIGIVQANRANNLYAQGFEPEGDAANANAKTMTIIGLILAGIGLLFVSWLWTGSLGSLGNFY